MEKMSRLSHLGLYTEASTANPLGVRPWNFMLANPADAPRSAPLMSGLRGYYPADYYVPTPCNVVMMPSMNVQALSGLGQAGPVAPSPFSDPANIQNLLLGGAAVVLAVALFAGRKKKGRR
jgi:hypothetical protein